MELKISNILFDNSMKTWVKSNCDDTARRVGIRLLPKSIIQPVGLLSQARLDSIEKSYIDKTTHKLPPINVKNYKLENGTPTQYYIILDGRHRVVKALYHNLLSIRVNT